MYSAGDVNPYTQITGLTINPDVKIYTMGYTGLVGSQDLMSWLAKTSNGAYYQITGSTEIPTTTNLIWLRLLGLQISYLSDEINSSLFAGGLAWQGGLA